MRSVLYVASALLFCACRASEVESDVPGAKFNKDELEAILKKEHSDRVSNIFDSENGIQHRASVKIAQPAAARAACPGPQRSACFAQGCTPWD